MQGTHFYEFGPYRLDVLTKRLLRDDEPLALTPKAFDTLLLLVRNRQRTLEKRELMKALWPDTFVEESNLTQQIFTLRRLLGEQPNGQPYIETLPKRGYLFAAPVTEVSDEPADGSALVARLKHQPEATGLPAEVTPSQTMSRTRSWRLPASVLAGAAMLAAAYLVFGPPGAQPSPASAPVMLAVLPFANLSGDPDQEYFSDGLTDEMITQLSRLDPQRLRVIARTSAMRYKGASTDAAQIGRELSVDYILEGSFRRESDRVRVSAQLIRTRDQTHVWAQNYTRDLRSLLELQSDVALAVANQVEIALAPQARTPPAQRRPIDSEAHQLYLKGLFFWNKRSAEAAVKAIEYFQQALQVDPKYALAWVGIANCYFSVSDPTLDKYRSAEEAARKALEIDETLAAAHNTLAFVALHRLDWRAAEEGFRRTLALDPTFGTGFYGEYLIAHGRFDEAIEGTRKGLELDPVSVVAVHGAGIDFYYARQYDRAIEQYRKALELDPNYYWSRLRLGYTYAQQGRYQEAIAGLQSLGPSGELALAYTYALMGEKANARKLLRRLLSRPSPSYEIAVIYAALGERDAALKWLETAAEQRHYHMIYLGVDPKLDPLRADPRFQEMLKRLGP